jgi:hypothetical protein
MTNALVNLLGKPGMENASPRILNILYCATGGENALGNSDSFPEIHAYAEFFRDIKQGDRLVYMYALFKALTPLLNKPLQKELNGAVLAHRDTRLAMLSLKDCLARHLMSSILLNLDSFPMEIPVQKKLPAAPQKAIQVTMDTLEAVFQETAHVVQPHPARRAMNLVYCAAGGDDAIKNPELCPETGAFARSLTELSDADRPTYVNDLLKKIGNYLMPQNKSYIEMLGDDVGAIKRHCERKLS